MLIYLQRLFRCFQPGSAYILPIIDGVEENEIERKLSVGLRKQKSAPLDSWTGIDTENDCVSLLEALKIENKAIINVFTDPTSVIFFSFIDLTLSAVFSPGGKIPNPNNGISVFRMLVGRTILRDVNDKNNDGDVRTLIFAVNSFVDVLEQRSKQFNVKSKSSLGASLTHDGSIILTVKFTRVRVRFGLRH
jgi:hypothetical protein